MILLWILELRVPQELLWFFQIICLYMTGMFSLNEYES